MIYYISQKNVLLIIPSMSDIILFQDKKIRRERDTEHEERLFSVVDIVWILSKSKDGRKYRNKLKQRLVEEWSEVVTNCHQLKMKAKDGKMRNHPLMRKSSVPLLRRKFYNDYYSWKHSDRKYHGIYVRTYLGMSERLLETELSINIKRTQTD